MEKAARWAAFLLPHDAVGMGGHQDQASGLPAIITSCALRKIHRHLQRHVDVAGEQDERDMGPHLNDRPVIASSRSQLRSNGLAEPRTQFPTFNANASTAAVRAPDIPTG
jgi:hypothetical protein